MRHLVLGMALFAALTVAAAVPGIVTRDAPEPLEPARPPGAHPTMSGPGFAVCAADGTWQRPSAAAQRAHVEGERRSGGTWEEFASQGDPFAAPAALYDGKSAAALQSIVDLTGLWTVWGDAASRARTCWSEQPQVFLFGFEAVSYDAQDPAVGVLRVRPAQGFREVVITGPIRPAVEIVADRRLDRLRVPAEWVTPAR